jgi:hypothetical protein
VKWSKPKLMHLYYHSLPFVLYFFAEYKKNPFCQNFRRLLSFLLPRVEIFTLTSLYSKMMTFCVLKVQCEMKMVTEWKKNPFDHPKGKNLNSRGDQANFLFEACWSFLPDTLYIINSTIRNQNDNLLVYSSLYFFPLHQIQSSNYQLFI